MYKIPEKYRKQPVHLRSNANDLFGYFLIPFTTKILFICIATNGIDEIPWEHVSVSLIDNKFRPIKRTPTWKEMCCVKKMFWDSEDTVIQFHPPESEYVSHHDYVLHLWRKQNENFETPPSIAIGKITGSRN